MKFENKLIEGTLIKRYKRFLVDVELNDGNVVTAHCANSGSMMSLLEDGNKVLLSPNTNPKAKLDWRWEIVDVGSSLVGINTSRPNYIVEEGILNGTIKQLSGYDNLRREVKYGNNSRIDILLEKIMEPSCYVEVKNVTLCREKGIVEFPDGVTARGAKHLAELSDMVKQGSRAVMIYLVNRTDCKKFRIAKDIDNYYYNEFLKAIDNGVEMLAYNVNINKNEIYTNNIVEIDKG